MKKVLITGANSYVGTNVEKWLMKEPTEYYVETLDMKDPNWKKFDFSSFHIVIHVAGIVHQKENAKNINLYYQVNSFLTIEVLSIAKNSGVSHFILFSTMSVYNSQTEIIEKKTTENPTSHYGRSKLLADIYAKSISEESFLVSIVRPPMIYGYNCKGNFQKLVKLAKFLPIFPDTSNRRSMIFIDNLMLFLKRNILENKETGILHPQNDDYINTSNLYKLIRKNLNKRTLIFKIKSYLLNFIPLKSIKKLFGSKIYSSCDRVDFVNFEESVKMSVVRNNE